MATKGIKKGADDLLDEARAATRAEVAVMSRLVARELSRHDFTLFEGRDEHDLERALDSIMEYAAIARDRIRGERTPQINPRGRGSKPGTYTRKIRRAIGYTYP